MSDGTKIAWTDATWNPIRARRRDGIPNKAGGGWICQRVSAGCQNCYAAGINKLGIRGGDDGVPAVPPVERLAGRLCREPAEGGEMWEWPEGLRVRQYPEVGR